ncbi:MAG TPA: SLBB domain-containing protein [Chloroflexaceae bacterium]|nr:SLBB domain-containing protein [Chloroflexaceae bacterium]
METATSIQDLARAAGLTGAGGAGFPTHVKLAARAEVVIANGAECEPLSHVDQELMIHAAPRVVAGLRLAMEATGAARGVLGLKKKYTAAIAALRAAIGDAPDLGIAELGNFYPAGDEQVLVYDVLGRVVPEGGLPIDVGAVVQNIETLVNLAAAADGLPVTHKLITVVGEVGRPMTVRVPLGVTIGEVIALAGGATTPDPVVLVGGAMMGHVAAGMGELVTKRTKLLLVLPYEHQLSVRRRQPRKEIERHAFSSCDQCFMCTDYCPRHAQGHAIQPHKLILLLASGVPLTDAQMAGALLCCECRTCNYACPVHLSPADIAISVKRDLLRAGLKNPYHRTTEVDPYREFRRVPIYRLVNRLGLERYDVPAPLTEVARVFGRVTLELRQHIGAAAEPVVRAGDRVAAGDLVAEVPAAALGARLHASISGVVREVTADAIVIESSGEPGSPSPAGSLR